MRFLASASASAALATALAALAALGCAGAGARSAAAPPLASAPAPAAVDAAPAPAAPSPTTDVAPPPPAPGGGVRVVAIPIAGTNFVRGRATLEVSAPLAKVREAVLDFGHYAEFMPYYKSSRVLGRTAAGARDVYMEIEALHGAVRLWVEIEIPKATIAEGVETYEARFVKGNVKDFKAIWRLRRIDDSATELSLEVFLEPQLPLPTALVNKGNLAGSFKGVTAIRARIESESESESEGATTAK
jgi:ribosome-associated toxin RatA of RatAB toxin-antitoxin module